MPRKPPARGSRHTPRPDGDDLGAADLAHRVAENVRALRRSRDLSLDELAAATGVSRAALSQVETARTNPTIGLLWKIAAGLGIPFSELLGATRPTASILRRGDTQVLQSADGRFSSRPLAPAGASPYVEVYELRLAARSRHASEAHAAGTREILIVLAGALRLVTATASYDLAAGDSVLFEADIPHAYENPGSAEARYHDMIIYPR